MYQFSSGTTIKPEPVIIPDLDDSQDLTRFLYQKKMDRQRMQNQFIKDLSVEDIEAIPQNLLDMQSTRRQEYYDKWTKRYKDSGGKLNEKDLLELTKEKSSLLREQKLWLMSQKNWQDQVTAYGKKPQDWDPSSAEALKQFDPNDPTKQYLTRAYTPADEIINKYASNLPKSNSLSEERLEGGYKVTETRSGSDALSEQNINATMLEHLATDKELQRTTTRDFLLDVKAAEDLVKEADESGTTDPKDQRYNLAKQFLERYSGENGLGQYFIDTKKKVYAQHNVIKLDKNLVTPKEKSEESKDKRQIIAPVVDVGNDMKKMVTWNFGMDAEPYNDIPEVAYTSPNSSGSKVVNPAELSGGKIVKVVKSRDDDRLYVAIKYSGKKSSEDGKEPKKAAEDPVKESFQSMVFEFSGANKEPKIAYIPYEDISGELKTKLNLVDIDKYDQKSIKTNNIRKLQEQI